MERDAVSILRVKQVHVELEWVIPNFLSLPHQKGDCLSSPPFVIGDARWSLRIYPNGRLNRVASSIALCLRRNDRTGEHSITYSLALKANGSMIKETTSTTTFDEERNLHGLPEFVRRSAISDFERDVYWDGAVTVFFSGRLLDGRNQNAAYTCRPEVSGVENLSSHWKTLFLDGRDTDVKLKVQGREFDAHKLVLGTRSPVFNAMFDHEMVEKISGVVEISDLNPDTFHDFLYFVYTGKFDIITPSNALELYKVADKYDMKDIKKESVFRMASWLTIDNIFDVVLFAETHEETDLLKHATEYFIKNLKEVLLTENWKTFLGKQTPLANDLLIKMANNL